MKNNPLIPIASIALISVIAVFGITTAAPFTDDQLAHYGQAVEIIESGQIEVADPAADEYDRVKDFGKAWKDVDENGCDTRNDILKRDVTKDIIYGDKKQCKVVGGKLYDVYIGSHREVSKDIQIDHIVALKDAWLSGANAWTQDEREYFANFPDNLIAADGRENASKGDGFVRENIWIPLKNPQYICDYVAKRVDLKAMFELHFLYNEKNSSLEILKQCKDGKVPVIGE